MTFIRHFKINILKIYVLANFVFINLFPQSISFNNLTVKDGLSNNKVLTVLQDKSGFLWFGTEDGLNRYDGYNFKVIRNDPKDSNSISSNNIWSLFEDEDGNIWIGTKSGEINRYNIKRDVFQHWEIKSENVQENSINKIYRDKNGIIWLGTYQSGLYSFNIDNNTINNWNYNPADSKSLSNNFVTNIIEDQDGFLWISTYNGLNRFNPKNDDDSFLRFYYDSNNSNSLSNDLTWFITKSEFNPELTWIGTANGLVSFNIKKQIFSRIPITIEKSLQFGNSFSSIVEKKINNENVLWLGTYGGLVRYNLENGKSSRFVKRENDPSAIINNEINSMIKDRSGVIWIATENGISYVTTKGMKFNNLFDKQSGFEESNELLKVSIKSIARSYNKNIFFGTAKGVYRYNYSSKHSSIEKYKSTVELNVWSMSDDANGNLWIGTYGQGLKQLNIKNGNLKNWIIESPTFKTSAYDYLKTMQIYDNNELWIGFWGGGLARFNTITGKYKIWITDPGNPKSLSHNDVWTIIRDRTGRMWIGTNGGGLNLFEDSEGGIFHRVLDRQEKLKQLSSKSIFSLCESKKGEFQQNDQTILWVGTSNGLNRIIIKNSSKSHDLKDLDVQVTSYSKENGLVDNAIKSILEDDDGNLWIGTNAGISFFNIVTNTFINFTNSDGLIGNEFNSSSACNSENGLMYFGSVDGLNIFDPKQIQQSKYVPPIKIIDFQIFNQPVNVGNDSPLKDNILVAKEIKLTYSQNVFSFQFAALDYNSPKSIQYAYMMEGFDDDWIYSGDRRFITYTNLNPATYSFKVKATNSDGVWSEDFKSILITIAPPWWRTGWAYVIYVTLIVIGIFTARKIEINRSRLRNELKMHEFEAKKQRELELMKSRFFANLSHEFKTPLTLIKGPVDELISGTANSNKKEYYELIKRNSEKLQDLIEQLLELTQLENAVIPLKAKKVNLVILIKGFVKSFDSMAKQKNISLSIYSTLDKVFCWVDIDKMEKIINNLLSNAIKFTSTGGKVEVKLTKELKNNQEIALVKISDNGIGIPQEKIEKIFDRFYQADDSSRKKFGGSGIGLALVKELIDLHRWEIEVESESDKGAEFSLSIPLWEDYLSENQKEYEGVSEKDAMTEIDKIDITKNAERIEDETEAEIIEKNKLLDGKPSVLIVEDSEDVRIFLRGILQNEFKIIEAIDGEDGIRKVVEVLPSLVISDVMMPTMNGFEFCKKIKTDWQTSHIPIILLTAKASTRSKIEGLETGADDYLTKPFNSKELLIRVKNLLEQRKKLREKFSQQINVDLASISVNSIDNEFLSKAFEVADMNLSNTDFSSEEFAKKMFLSRSQLHRKLIAITGQAPGEFIRTFRLKKAARLILEKRLSITQIAFEVGFSSPSHFTKAFRQQFNCLPTEFTEQTNI